MSIAFTDFCQDSFLAGHLHHPTVPSDHQHQALSKFPAKHLVDLGSAVQQLEIQVHSLYQTTILGTVLKTLNSDL